jgi:hypothetical protein
MPLPRRLTARLLCATILSRRVYPAGELQLLVCAMLHPDRRQAEREDKRVELNIIACLSAVLVFAIALVGLGLTRSPLWPAQA